MVNSLEDLLDAYMQVIIGFNGTLQTENRMHQLIVDHTMASILTITHMDVFAGYAMVRAIYRGFILSHLFF